MEFLCLKQEHFEPEVLEASPYERLSHAALAWLAGSSRLCDLVHGHEWGGVMVDAATASYYRQLRPGLRLAIEPHGGHIWCAYMRLRCPCCVFALSSRLYERLQQMSCISQAATSARHVSALLVVAFPVPH